MERSLLGVSVVIPHYGSPAPARDLVAQLQTQQTRHPLQIVVVDDHSPEPFPETPGVAVVRRDRNGGFGSAVNSGVALVEHELLLVMNSDVTIPERFIDRLVSAAEPWLPAVVSPYVVDGTGHDASAGRHFPTTSQQVVEWCTPLARWRPYLREAVGHDTRVGPGHDTVVDWAFGACLLLSTADFRAVGGFDERFFMNAEEVDLQRRLRERGLPTIVLGGVSVVHEGGASSDPALRRAWLVDARLRYADKWGGRRRLVMALRLATLANLFVNLGRRAVGRPVAPFSTAHAEWRLVDATQRAAQRATQR